MYILLNQKPILVDVEQCFFIEDNKTGLVERYTEAEFKTLRDVIQKSGEELFTAGVDVTNYPVIESEEELINLQIRKMKNCGYVFGTKDASNILGNRCIIEAPKNINRVVIGYGVKGISKDAFRDNSTIEELILSSTVESINCSAFRNCVNLSSIVFNKGLVTIDREAFAGCVSLVKLELPDSLRRVQTKAFEACTGLTNVKFPEHCDTVMSGVFLNCTNLNTLVLPSRLRTLPAYALEKGELPKLEKVVIYKDCSVQCMDTARAFAYASSVNCKITEI